LVWDVGAQKEDGDGMVFTDGYGKRWVRIGPIWASGFAGEMRKEGMLGKFLDFFVNFPLILGADVSFALWIPAFSVF
jgi:hypothetical protein